MIKFPPSRDGKGVKCPGEGGMLKLRFDRYINQNNFYQKGHIFEKSGEIRVTDSTCKEKSQLNTEFRTEVQWLGLSTFLKTVGFQ